jgi:excisionase family DNA binding protein
MSYITTKEAGTILDLTDARVRQLVKAGELPAKKIGDVVLIIPESAVIRLKAKRAKKNGKSERRKAA